MGDGRECVVFVGRFVRSRVRAPDDTVRCPLVGVAVICYCKLRDHFPSFFLMKISVHIVVCV